MYKFFAGHSPLPEKYTDAFISNLLGLSWTELEKQPDWWVLQMIEFHEQKSKYETNQQKLKEAKAKPQSSKVPRRH